MVISAELYNQSFEAVNESDVNLKLTNEEGEQEKENLIYNKDRTFAFVMAFGPVSDEWYANAVGAVNWGFPTIADTPIPEILPTGVCTYEHVVSNIPHDNIVAKAVEVRGLKVSVAEVPIPVAFGPAFEGERVRGDDIYLECGGGRTPMVEWLTTKEMDEVEDGKVELEYRRVSYDVDRVSKAILREGLPQFLAQRLYLGV